MAILLYEGLGLTKITRSCSTYPKCPVEVVELFRWERTEWWGLISSVLCA